MRVRQLANVLLSLLFGLVIFANAGTLSAVTVTLYIHEGSMSGPVVPGARVTGTDGAGTSFDQTTNASGYVAINGTPGTWQITVSKTGYQTSSWSQSVSGSGRWDGWMVRDTATVTLYIHEGSVSGPVVPGARVTGTDGAGASFDQTTNASGYVTINGTPGTWQITASKTGYQTSSWSQSVSGSGRWDGWLLPISSNVTLTLYVHDGSPSGPVLPGVRVTGSNDQGATFDQTTNPSGYVTITGAPGTWYFTASKTGYQAKSWSAPITSSGSRDAFLTAVSNVVTLTLYVHDGSSGGPVLSGVRIIGNDSAGATFDQTTNPSGYVMINGAPGTWQFFASKTNYQSNTWSQDILATGRRDAVLYIGATGTLPAAPSNLTATGISVTQINLSWDDNSNNEDGFKIERKIGVLGTWSQIATLAGTTIYQNTGLLPNTLYYYRVRAYNGIGNSAYSNEVSKTTLSPQCNITLYNDLQRFGSPRVVSSVCADGTPSTLVVLSIDTSLDPNGIAMTIMEGESGSLQITSRRTGRVEARYTAPDSFRRSGNTADLDAMKRTVNIRVRYQTTQYGLDRPLDLYRPPVVMIHGLWTDDPRDAWGKLTAYLAAIYPATLLHLANYSKTSADSFITNRDACGKAVNEALNDARDAGFSAGKADVIAHSMGGILVRMYLSNFGKECLYRDDIHKFISIGTPHSGSQAADYLMSDSVLQWILKKRNHPCDKGAVADLCVDSTAIEWVNRSRPGTARVPSHALATTARYSDGTFNEQAIYIIVSKEHYSRIMEVICNAPYSIPQKLFGESSDLIGPLSGQKGGLTGAMTEFSNTSHMNQPGAPDIHARLKQLLNLAPQASVFSMAGFAPPDLHYTEPDWYHSTMPPQKSSLKSVGTVQIVSPTSGGLVSAGTTITIQVSISGATTGVLVASPSAVSFKDTSPFTFKIGVPRVALGCYPVIAVGFGATDVTATHTVDLKVTTAATLVRLEPLPGDTLYAVKGQTSSLSVMGEFSDGLKRNLTSGQLGTRYSITNRAIATLAGDGIVRGVAPGTTTLTISNGTVLRTVSVVVLPSLATAAKPTWSLYK